MKLLKKNSKFTWDGAFEQAHPERVVVAANADGSLAATLARPMVGARP